MHHRIPLLLLTLGAFVLRAWALAAKGLAYDEAATALMARATPAAILQFHWEAAFEHPPLWQLLMHFWSTLAGQSEYALRFLPALAGVLAVPLGWILIKRLEIGNWRVVRPRANLQLPISNLVALVSGLLTAVSPILVLYSQEARMYTLVVALALASLYAAYGLAGRPALSTLLSFVLINWLLLGLHYYSVLLVGAEVLYFWLVLIGSHDQNRGLWRYLAAGVIATLLPLALWMGLAPGFRQTAAVIFQTVDGEQVTLAAFLDSLWRDLSFGAIRWQPAQAWLGCILLPLLVIGIICTLWPFLLKIERETGRPRERPGDMRRGADDTDEQSQELHAARSHWLLLLALFVPIFMSALLFRTLATRYILFVAPVIYLLIGLAIVWLWRVFPPFGGVALALALVVAGAGLYHYFFAYEKSAYRQMAASLALRRQPEDGILLEAPRQHLLAKYYLPSGWHFYTAPHVDLPAYWPVNAPPVVPEDMDDRLQAYLRQHRALWLILTAEDEVDLGEFVPKYLTAVSFREECQDWIDLRLCRFVSPHFTPPALTAPATVQFGGELVLQSADVALTQEGDGGRFLLTTLHWLASSQPSLDYRVTLRLTNPDGAVVSQHDDFPIGSLLPPTTWNAGDEKPGYMALPILPGLAPGVYHLVVGVYDPTTAAPVSYTQDGAEASGELLTLAVVEIGDEIVIRNT